MTPDEYKAALSTLGLSQKAAGRWLGICPRTAHTYATRGPTKTAALAVRQALELRLAVWGLKDMASVVQWAAKRAAKAGDTIGAEQLDGCWESAMRKIDKLKEASCV